MFINSERHQVFLNPTPSSAAAASNFSPRVLNRSAVTSLWQTLFEAMKSASGYARDFSEAYRNSPSISGIWITTTTPPEATFGASPVNRFMCSAYSDGGSKTACTVNERILRFTSSTLAVSNAANVNLIIKSRWSFVLPCLNEAVIPCALMTMLAAPLNNGTESVYEKSSFCLAKEMSTGLRKSPQGGEASALATLSSFASPTATGRR